jgi:hypothetical protein
MKIVDISNNNINNNDKNLTINIFGKIKNLKYKINKFDIIYDQNKIFR